MQQNFTFFPKDVCCRAIYIELDGNRIKHVSFTGGCSGCLQGIAAMVTGEKAEDVIERLGGIECNNRETSCPDQLALALKEMLAS